MSNTLILGSQRLYVVTPEGRAAASAEASCQCDWRVNVNCLVCCKCGTAVELRRQDVSSKSGKPD